MAYNISYHHFYYDVGLMKNFAVGQKVLCINDEKIPGITIAPYVVAGNVYTITDIVSRKASDKPWHDDFFALAEMGKGPVYFAWRFKPLDDPALDTFRKMCEKPPTKMPLKIVISPGVPLMVFDCTYTHIKI